jgi:hypothetical protein
VQRGALLLVLIAAAGAALAIGACSASNESALPLGDSVADGGSSPPPQADGEPSGDAGARMIPANGIILVHAATFPAFRICFTGLRSERPMPSRDVMPESNVVGVDIGAAVRLPPRSERLGEAWVFEEPTLRPLYPAFDGNEGPTCGDLLDGALQSKATRVAADVTTDVSRGVHLFVLTGCRKASLDPNANVERCGDDWNPTDGNLALKIVTLDAFQRPGPNRLAVQVIQLSQGIVRRANGRALGISFGPIDDAGAPFVEGAVPFGVATPSPPATIEYAPDLVAAYGTTGVHVTLGADLVDGGLPDGGDPDAGPREIVLTQSLAEIQRRSAPRSLPPDWYSAPSSYIIMSLGEHDPRHADGGATDDDARRALHILALPLAEPDAGN